MPKKVLSRKIKLVYSIAGSHFAKFSNYPGLIMGDKLVILIGGVENFINLNPSSWYEGKEYKKFYKKECKGEKISFELLSVGDQRKVKEAISQLIASTKIFSVEDRKEIKQALKQLISSTDEKNLIAREKCGDLVLYFDDKVVPNKSYR